MRLRFFLATGLFLTIAVTSFAQTIPFDTAVRTGKLANGFTYFIRHNAEPKNRVTFYLVNKVGSVLEDEDQRGLAHFMEHMSFDGTTHFPHNELINYLQKAGVQYGADINAYTKFDETVYQLPIPSDNPEVLKTGIEIMHDWAHGATLDPSEIARERGPVLEEKRLKKGAADRMNNKYLPLILNNSRYANRSPIGTDEVLNNFKRETLKRFYDDWYRPDLQAIIVVGDIDAGKMEQIIKTKFADLKNPANERPRTRYTIPLNTKDQFITVTDPEMTSTEISVLIKKPEVPLHTIAQYREHIVEDLFNSMMDARLDEVWRQPVTPFLDGNISIDKFMGNLDAYSIEVEAKPGELEKGFKTIWKENERAKRFGFTATELERAKNKYFQQVESRYKEQGKINSDDYVQEYLRYFLNGEATPGISYEYNLVKKDLQDITLADVNTIAKTNSKNTGRDILLLAPEKDKAKLPNEAIITGWMSAVGTEDIKPYKDETNTAALISVEPVPGKIISRSKDGNGITTLMLSNGVKVLLKPTNFKNDEIIFNGFAAGGTSLYSDADYESALAANTISAMGAGNYNFSQLEKYLSGKQISIGVQINSTTETISGSALKENLDTAMQLMYAHIVEPRKDTTEFKGMINRTIAGLSNQNDDPSRVFGDTVRAVLTNYNVRYTGDKLEKVHQINLDRAFEIFKERFGNARGYTFVFVGNIDTATTDPLIEKYIASLPATGPVVEAKDLNIHPLAGVVEKTVYKGLEPKATVELVFSGPFEYSHANRLKMEALKEILNIRLVERLRIDESGVYDPYATVSFEKIPEERFTLTINFGCAPQNVNKLIASALDEIEKIKKDGPLPVNLDKFKAEDQREAETQLRTNDFWASYLSSQIQNHEHLDQITTYAQYKQQIDAITTDGVKNIASQYITGKNYIKLLLMPEKK